jgi:anti-sigma28 factor (negative regulator of flagellin synthesis)
VSMRVACQTDMNAIDNARSGAARAATTDSKSDFGLSVSGNSDRVNLSSASGLLALAKGLTPPDKQEKIAQLSLQVRSGQYRTDDLEIGRALLNDHFKQ